MEWFHRVHLEIVGTSVFVPVHHRQKEDRVYETPSHGIRTRLLVEKEMSVDLFTTQDHIENLQIAFEFDKFVDL